jgi:predicted DNA-binding antitoxin AbrB/MazE fold protein
MAQIINAIYEEGVLKPLEPLDIKEHTKVRIIIEPEKDRKRSPHQLAIKTIQSYYDIGTELL